MSLTSIAWAYLRAKWLSSCLHITVMALGMALMTVLLLVGYQMNERLYRDGAGIDVVVGAKGSPLQLILSAVQHMDIPTGNIPLSEAQRLKHHPQVKALIPLSLGDQYQQFRIVGTSHDYVAHFSGEYASGTAWDDSMQAVIGARVAEASGLKVGDSFVGSHGLMEGGHAHGEHPYIVTGILKPTGAVLDRLILTSLHSVWEVHDKGHGHDAHAHEHEPHHHDHDDEVGDAHHDHHDHDHHDHAYDDHTHDHDEDSHHAHHEAIDAEGHHHGHHDHHHGHHRHEAIDDQAEQDLEVTALLITYRNRAAIMSFPRNINQHTSMQAASPALEMARLLELIGIGSDSAMLFAGFLIAVALANVMVGLLNRIRERRRDLAIFRTLGASRFTIMLLVLIEGMLIAIIGSLIGLVLGHGLVEAIGSFTARGADLGLRGLVFYADIWLVWAMLLLLSLLACLIPAWESYRTDIHSMLRHA